jgi:hypothetical protein
MLQQVLKYEIYIYLVITDVKLKRLFDAQLQQQIDNEKYDIIYLNIHVYVDATYIYAYLSIINNMYHFLL